MQSPTSNGFIKIKIDAENRVTNTGIRQKVLLQVSVCEPHIDTLKKYYTAISMAYDEKGLVRIIQDPSQDAPFALILWY